MTIGIVGLGLIGGSFAKAFSEMTDNKIYGFDISDTALFGAKLTESISDELNSKNISECDIIIVSLYPRGTIEYVKNNAKLIKKGAIVVDCCGVKRSICDALLPVAKENGFVFVGGHPMAGTQVWGFEHSRSSMFKGASMILTSTENLDISELEKLKNMFCSIGFSNIQFSSAENHDRIIAFTSQLAHVVSNAYVKSESAQMQKGFSAGSYKDLTRVAKLNEEMWTDLFLLNCDNLTKEIDNLIENLTKYSEAIKNNDADTLKHLLKEGKESKQTAK